MQFEHGCYDEMIVSAGKPPNSLPRRLRELKTFQLWTYPVEAASKPQTLLRCDHLILVLIMLCCIFTFFLNLNTLSD